MKIGDPLDRSTAHGPQNHRAHFEKLQKFVERGVAEGQNLLGRLLVDLLQRLSSYCNIVPMKLVACYCSLFLRIFVSPPYPKAQVRLCFCYIVMSSLASCPISGATHVHGGHRAILFFSLGTTLVYGGHHVSTSSSFFLSCPFTLFLFLLPVISLGVTLVYGGCLIGTYS